MDHIHFICSSVDGHAIYCMLSVFKKSKAHMTQTMTSDSYNIAHLFNRTLSQALLKTDVFTCEKIEKIMTQDMAHVRDRISKQTTAATEGREKSTVSWEELRVRSKVRSARNQHSAPPGSLLEEEDSRDPHPQLLFCIRADLWWSSWKHCSRTLRLGYATCLRLTYLVHKNLSPKLWSSELSKPFLYFLWR